jgi:phage terminase large subunit-like protein
VKNAEEASSVKKRQTHREWYQSTFSTRGEPDAAIIIMCTRWDLEDLPGWILETEWENQDEPDALERWHIVNFSAIKESPEEIAAREAIDGRAAFPPSCTVEPDWRQPGEALAPERYPIGALQRIRKRIGEYFFGALYQQHPRIREGGRFTLDMLPIVDDFPRDGVKLVRWWDRAATEDGGDYTAGALVARDVNGIYYLVDLVHGQWGDLKRDLIIKATTQVDAANYGSKLVTWSEQEPGSAGVDQANAFRRLLDGFTVYTERTTGDKESYIGPLASTAQAGNLRLVRGPWNATARREFLDYPGKLDDIVESAARAASKLAPRGRSQALPDSVSQLSYN